jgi:hypothetical protein
MAAEIFLSIESILVPAALYAGHVATPKVEPPAGKKVFELLE